MDWVQEIYVWFLSLGTEYGVNPLLFGAIYIGAVPLFTISVAWIVRNYRRGTSIALPVLSASFFFVSAYLYLIIAGQNVPWWVYAVVVAMLLYGGYSTFNKVKVQVQVKNEENK